MAKYRHVLVLACILILLFILFGSVRSHGFNSDDYLLVYYATYHPTPSFVEGLKSFVRPSWELYYRPAAKLLLEAMVKYFGLWAGGYHFVSLICYAALCFEVYLLGLFLTGRTSEAIAAALIFAASSAHAQAVFWIAGLNGAAENILTLMSLIFFVAWHKNGQAVLYLLSLMIFILGLLIKESAISLPMILIFYTALLGGEMRFPIMMRRTVRRCGPFLLVAFFFVLLRAKVMSQIHLPPSLTSFGWKTFIIGLWYSLIMTLSPIDWALPARWFNALTSAGLFFFLPATIGILAIAFVPIIQKKFTAAFLIWWILTGAAPVLALGLVPSERHVVFGSAGAAVLLSILLFRLADRTGRKFSMTTAVIGWALVAVFTLPNCYFLKQRQAAWRHAAEVAGSIVGQVTEMYPTPEKDSTLFFFNVPDSINGAFVFRFDNLSYALRDYYDGKDVEAVRIVSLVRIPQGSLASRESSLFKIRAMGGYIYVPTTFSEDASLLSRWQRLEDLGILKKDLRYLAEWDSYDASPFFIYAGNSLVRAPSSELKSTFERLFSVD